jgi:HSP20 family molecular chaperone IbpA
MPEVLMPDQENAAMTENAANAETVSDAPTFMPPTDVFETKDGFVMLLDMPGTDPDSLNVTLEKRMLTLSARAKPMTPQGYTPVHAEYRDGNYERVFMLSEDVDGDRIDAMFKDGVLRLNLPKTTPSPAKKITVKAA